jgi:hypothetical protein
MTRKIPPPTGGPAGGEDAWEHCLVSLVGIALTRRKLALERAMQLPATSAEAMLFRGQAAAWGEAYELLRECMQKAVQ